MGLGREFLKYVIPSMLTYMLMGAYSIVDGLFVGNAVGDAGLAGINIAYPLYTLVLAVGTGIGVGGSVIMSIRFGENDDRGAHRASGTAIAMLLLSSLVVLALLRVFAVPLNQFLGGSGESLRYAVDYTEVLALGAPFQVMAAGMLPIVRNRGHVNYAMAVSMISGVLNACLDYVFVFALQGGTAGAATATVCAQCFSFMCCVAFLLRPSQRMLVGRLMPDTKDVLHIVKLGIAPLGLALLPTVTIAAINVNAMAYGGQPAVAAYGVVTYVTYIIQALIQSVGDGAQPLISRYLGAGEMLAVRRLRGFNYAFGITLGIMGIIVMACGGRLISSWFGISGEATDIGAYALKVFAVAYLFYGFTHASTTFFYAIDSARYSNALVCVEAVLIVPSVVGFSQAFGIDGVWWSVAFVQMVICAIAAALVFRSKGMFAPGDPKGD